jgi:hypothetical protein
MISKVDIYSIYRDVEKAENPCAGPCLLIRYQKLASVNLNTPRGLKRVTFERDRWVQQVACTRYTTIQRATVLKRGGTMMKDPLMQPLPKTSSVCTCD